MTPFLAVELRVDCHLKAPVVQRLASATQRLKHFPVDGMVGFDDTPKNMLSIISNL